MKVDVAFHLKGELIPADHGFCLFSAISKILPVIHGDEGVGIHAIAGNPRQNRNMELTTGSRLTFRIDSDRISQLFPLSGTRLRLGGAELRIGSPTIYNLIPSPRVYSRLVIIKGFMEPKDFLQNARERLVSLGIKGNAKLKAQSDIQAANSDRSGGSKSSVLRRTVRIRDKNIVGFALGVEELTPEESIFLQEIGLGGRRRFGCGLFIPNRR